MIPRTLILLFAAATAFGCKPLTAEPPPAQDAGPIYGCYKASDAPPLIIDAAVIKIAGLEKAVPYRYELPKVGTVLRVPVDAITDEQNRLSFVLSDSRFYRVLHSDAGPVIRVAFGKQGVVRDYYRQPPGTCDK